MLYHINTNFDVAIFFYPGWSIVQQVRWKSKTRQVSSWISFYCHMVTDSVEFISSKCQTCTWAFTFCLAELTRNIQVFAHLRNLPYNRVNALKLFMLWNATTGTSWTTHNTFCYAFLRNVWPLLYCCFISREFGATTKVISNLGGPGIVRDWWAGPRPVFEVLTGILTVWGLDHGPDQSKAVQSASLQVFMELMLYFCSQEWFLPEVCAKKMQRNPHQSKGRQRQQSGHRVTQG